MALITSEDFIERFHKIEGIKLSERLRNFHKLLAEFAQLKDNAALLDEISSTLTPKNYLESLLKLDFLIYFKRTEDIFEYLKTGNDVFVSKIAQQVWFFKSAFNETPPDKLVNELLPNMSYCVRAKILSKLSRYVDDERFDQIFDAVAARYGIYFASNYLIGCSESKIKTVLNNYKINDLSSVQLKVLYDKNVDLIRQYFENYKVDLIKHKKFLLFLHRENLKLLNELEFKYKFKLKLGRRNTKKFVIANKDDIIKTPIDYLDKIDMKAALRKIGAESEMLIKNTLPSKIKDIGHTHGFNQIKRFIPSKYLYKIYFNTIQNHYNQKLCDHSDLITDDLIKIIQDTEERVKLAKIKVDQSSENFLSFVPYLTSEEAISLIKSKINLTSADRSNLIQALVKTCGINKDMESLLQVLKYFYNRHRNESGTLILVFLSLIRYNFNLQDFNEEIWILIRDIMAVYSLKFGRALEGTQQEILSKLEPNSTLYSEFLMYCCNVVYGESETYHLSYMEYMFKHGKLTEETTLNFLYSQRISFLGRDDYSNEFTLYLMKTSVANLEQIANMRKRMPIHYAIELILLLNNKLYTDQNITLFDFPILTEYFYEISNSPKYQLQPIRTIFREKLFTPEDNPIKAKHLQIYCGDRHEFFFEVFDLKWFLHYKPQILLDYFDTMKSSIVNILKLAPNMMGKCNRIPADRRFIQHCIKKFSHLGLDQLVIDHCKSVLNSDSDKIAAIRCLSILLPAKEYIDIGKSYEPIKKKIDLKDDEVKDYQLMCNIAENFKYTNDYRALDSVLNYLCGDFLKYAFVSLSSLLHKTPENQLEKYLEFLRNNPAVSVRKHCYFFTRFLCDSNTIENTFKSVIVSEKDDSLQRRIFESLLNHFEKNPEQRYYEIIKTCFNFIKEEDTELHRKINKTIPKIADRYKAAFIIYVWEYLEKLITRPRTLRDLQIQLLRHIDEKCAANIPLDFALKLIEKHLPISDTAETIPQDYISHFAFTVLISKEEKIQVLNTVFNVINTLEDQREIYWIHNSWTHRILELKKEQNIDFLPHYITYWQSKLDPVEDFTNYLYLFYLQLKTEFHTEISIPKISDKIVQFYEQIIAEYGLCILTFLKDAFKDLLPYFTNDQITDYDFYYYIVSNYQSTGIVVMIIELLPGKEEESSRKYVIYKKIVEKIKTIKEPAVRIHAKIFWE